MTRGDVLQLFNVQQRKGVTESTKYTRCVRYAANCPAHPDNHQSLDIKIWIGTKYSDDQRVRRMSLCCQAGCSAEAILDAVNINPDKEDMLVDGWNAPESLAAEDAMPAVWRERTAEETSGHIRNLVSMYQEAGRQLAEMGQALKDTRQEMAAMAETLRISNERMAAMEKTMRTLEKVTPQQAARVNQMIRERAEAICEEYGIGLDWAPWTATISANAAGIVMGAEQSAADAGGKSGAEKRKAMAAAIRKELREMTGVRTAREICRCDLDAVKEFVSGWEDWDTIQRIRKGTGLRGKTGPGPEAETGKAGGGA